MSKRTRRKYSPEFKAEAVRLVLSGRRTVAAIARELDVTRSGLRQWVLEAQARENPASPIAKLKERAPGESEELARLRKENERLRMERDFLKKAAAFFAKEST